LFSDPGNTNTNTNSSRSCSSGFGWRPRQGREQAMPVQVQVHTSTRFQCGVFWHPTVWMAGVCFSVSVALWTCLDE
jgi:hypothetical protein